MREPVRGRPTFAQILDWVEGRLPPADAEAVRQRVDEHPTSGEAATWVREFLDACASVRRATPPRAVHERLVERFDLASGPAEEGPIQRLLASLSYDSGGMIAAAGVRGIGEVHASARHLVLSSAAADVALDLYPSDDEEVRVEGQVLPSAPAPPTAPVPGAAPEPRTFLVVLERADGVVACAETDDLGLFALGTVRAGPCTLLVAAPGTQVVAGLDLSTGR